MYVYLRNESRYGDIFILVTKLKKKSIFKLTVKPTTEIETHAGSILN